MSKMTEGQKEKYKEWVKHFLLDGVDVEKLEDSDRYVIGTRDTDLIPFNLTGDESFVATNFERHRFIQTDPVHYETAEKAWNKALYEARNNPTTLTYAREQAREAMRYNREAYKDL